VIQGAVLLDDVLRPVQGGDGGGLEALDHVLHRLLLDPHPDKDLVGDVDSHLDQGGRDQEAPGGVLELEENALLVFGRQFAMNSPNRKLCWK